MLEENSPYVRRLISLFFSMFTGCKNTQTNITAKAETDGRNNKRISKYI